MNRNRIDNEQPAPSAIDTILSTDEKLMPSSGFLASVMDRVHEEARMPAPLPFPWKRAIPGIVLATGVFGWGAVEFARQAIPAMHALSFAQLQLLIPDGLPIEDIGWVALALAISLASWLLSRLAGQSGEL